MPHDAKVARTLYDVQGVKQGKFAPKEHVLRLVSF